MDDRRFPRMLHSAWLLVVLTGRLPLLSHQGEVLFPLIVIPSVFLALYSHLSVLFANLVRPFYAPFLSSGAHFLTLFPRVRPLLFL